VSGGRVDIETLLRPWSKEPTPRTETRCSPRGRDGYFAWNCKSPEVEFCEMAGALTKMLRPALVVETGTGQGYATRRIAWALRGGGRFITYEADADLREALRTRARLPKGVEVSEAPTFSDDIARDGDLFVLDSGRDHRFAELARWQEHAKEGSMVLIHDTGYKHEGTDHVAYARTIRELGIRGVWFPNPRGSFLGQR
jgi:Methyltransferase domain